jgi:hypothetical protein
VALNGVAYDMTGMALNMVIRNKKGTAVKTLSSTYSVGANITISTSTFNISTTAFTDGGLYDFDLQLTDGTDIMTIMVGKILVEKQIT